MYSDTSFEVNMSNEMLKPGHKLESQTAMVSRKVAGSVFLLNHIKQ